LSNIKNVFSLSLLILSLSTASAVEAQGAKKPPQVGFLAGVSESAISARLNAFRQGLRDHGYLEGHNIIIEPRYAQENLRRLDDLAKDLVRLKVAAIVTGGPPATRSTKKVTSTIPIIMGFDSDPVGNGFITSLARPGANITGLSALSFELSGKQLELLKEAIPGLSHLAVIGSPPEPANARILDELKRAAPLFGLSLHNIDVLDSKAIENAFQLAAKNRAEAALVLPSAFTFAERFQFVQLAARNRLPTMYGSSDFVEAGGLIAYGTDYLDLFRRAATYVDKILKGSNPANLPVEQPTKFELIMNLKTAKQIGLTIPPQVLARADRVIR
jgi:putative tryptophan/tyrosine transport system substrate-binding protein